MLAIQRVTIVIVTLKLCTNKFLFSSRSFRRKLAGLVAMCVLFRPPDVIHNMAPPRSLSFPCNGFAPLKCHVLAGPQEKPARLELPDPPQVASAAARAARRHFREPRRDCGTCERWDIFISVLAVRVNGPLMHRIPTLRLRGLLPLSLLVIFCLYVLSHLVGLQDSERLPVERRLGTPASPPCYLDVFF